MKKLYLCIALIYCLLNASAQSWNINGNSGLTNNNFLGTTNAKDLIFKVNNTERGRLLKTGNWRFGSAVNNAGIDSGGRLSFSGIGTYLVGNNKYVFQNSANPNYGLFFKSSVPQYEFRNGSAVPVFYVNANNGNTTLAGSLKIGAYTLPATDGTNGQVLTTNGTGTVSWSTAGNGKTGANKTLSNLAAVTKVNVSLLPGTNASIDLGSSAKAWRNIYLDGSLFAGTHKIFTVDTVLLNTVLGDGAFLSNTSGLHNTATGYYALANNTTGSDNMANGFYALLSNTTGNDNAASGFEALVSNTTGYQNTAVGAATLFSNTTGNSNSGSGFEVLASNTMGSQNTGNGAFALFYNTTGNYNTANGFTALYSNTTGNDNTATGRQSLQSNNTGYDNTANGSSALFANTTGFGNSAFGWNALNFNITGNNNSACGTVALLSNTTGNANTANGYYALSGNTIGSFNTAIGYSADVATSNLSNATAIGSNALVDASDKVRIGNTAVTSIGGQVGWTSFSDGRFKKNIKEDVQGLKFINLLKPISYTVDVNALNAYYHKNKKHDSVYDNLKKAIPGEANKASAFIHNGFIAQDVEKAAASLRYNFSGVDKPQTEDGLYGLRYSDFVVPLVKAVQELSRMNDEKDEKIDSLQKQFTELKTLVLRMQQTQQQCSPCNAALNASTQQNILTQDVEPAKLASLEQNVPNPFANTTSIGYYLPQKFTSAKIIITDRNSKVLQQLNITGPGKGTVHVNAAAVASGAYYYTLYVDGKLIASKQMELLK
ncbi:MAG TPA: tail fiber domain-containing protein [Parafilimonas sp.]|nr:tail fiber domain-containing protein [Parafilimonas sp.]